MTGTTDYSPEYLAQSKATALNVCYAIPIALELISTSLRLWARTGRHAHAARLGIDDYLIVVATTVAIAECISGLIYGAPYGLGRHIQALTPHDLRMYMMGNYIFSHFYDVAIGTTKLSVLALYHRLFSTGLALRIVILATAAFVTSWIIVMEVVLGVACRPVQAFWDAAARANGTCINLEAFTYFTNITNLVTDVWIFGVPIPVIMALRTSRDYKLELCAVFSIGLATCAISAARLSFVFGVGSKDYTWFEASLGILSAWEPCGGILCANLPIIYGPFKRYVRNVGASGSTLETSQRSAHEMGRGISHGGQGRLSGISRNDWTRLNNSGSMAGAGVSRDVLPGHGAVPAAGGDAESQGKTNMESSEEENFT